MLLSIEGVRDCAVFGVPDEEFGEALVAAIEPAPGASLSAEQIQAQLKARIASYKVPRRIELMERLPREDSGKLFKRKLKARFG